MHKGFLSLTNFFATQFKTGAAPAITQDQLVLWARPHPKNPNAPDPVAKPNNYEMVHTLLQSRVIILLTPWAADPRLDVGCRLQHSALDRHTLDLRQHLSDL